MKAKRIFTVGLFLLFMAVSSVSAQEKVYYDVVQKLMDFEFANSDVMENASWLCDVFGGRNVKTPAYREACEWAKERLKEYGLSNARLEPYDFGNGWDIDYVSVHMVAPKYMPIIMDIGPGRVRGIGCAGSEVLRAIFKEWIKPLHGIGMAHIFTTGAMHSAYTEVGLLGLTFDHDRKEIDVWNAHTNMDVYERLFPDGMMQTAVVVATLAYHAAMRDEKLPRVVPLPW